MEIVDGRSRVASGIGQGCDGDVCMVLNNGFVSLEQFLSSMNDISIC